MFPSQEGGRIPGIPQELCAILDQYRAFYQNMNPASTIYSSQVSSRQPFNRSQPSFGHQEEREFVDPAESRKVANDPILVGPLLKFSNSLSRSIKKSDENVVFSPLSIHLCLNMFSLGVKEGSQTASDLSGTLGYSHLQPGELTQEKIHQANAELKRIIGKIKRSDVLMLDMLNYVLSYNVTLVPKYIEDIKKYYEGAVRPILSKQDQEEVILEIGKWCEEAGFKENILTSDDIAKSNVILLNAVRVEPEWFDEFREIYMAELFYNYGRPDCLVRDRKGLALGNTRVVFFELTKNERSPNAHINAPIRGLNQKEYDELADLEFRVIKIELRGSITYTIIEPLNPDASNGGGLERLESALMDSTVDSKMSKLLRLLDGAETVLANLRMPGFKFEQDVNLVDHLKSIGLERIFDSKQCPQDTREITPSGVFVRDVKHKALIEVNDKGIKAAAVTMMGFGTCSRFCIIPEPVELKVQHPFMFLLRFHELPLFVGHLVHI